MDITFELDLSSAALALAGLCGGLIILIEHHAKQHLIDKRRFSSTLGKAALFLFFPFINSIVASIFSTYTYIDKAQVLFMFSALCKTGFQRYHPYVDNCRNIVVIKILTIADNLLKFIIVYPIL